MSTEVYRHQERTLERAGVCILVVWAVYDLWGGPEPEDALVEDVAYLLMHLKDETFLDEVRAAMTPLQGMSPYDVRQFLATQQHDRSYKGVSSVWARLIEVEPRVTQKWETEVHLWPGSGVVES